MATKGTVCGVIANMVTLKVDGPVAQNEICYIVHRWGLATLSFSRLVDTFPRYR